MIWGAQTGAYAVFDFLVPRRASHCGGRQGYTLDST
ncbi:hypothetical protein PF003_g17680 [Phytophthora fragariae]|nr:hypothetical protein PF003_g17712 [Phytophthora fragariae]KAE8898647.1 hypothetical protein PF003_g17680 [Phytophthora fragariae]